MKTCINHHLHLYNVFRWRPWPFRASCRGLAPLGPPISEAGSQTPRPTPFRPRAPTDGACRGVCGEHWSTSGFPNPITRRSPSHSTFFFPFSSALSH
uniref:Uncharacterized protein n=1 Tax=Glycine max TaxID=3847 RepID=C6SXV4_SOYBN|nr:unknown [Glycine max]